MNALRIAITAALAPLMLLGALAYLAWRGLRGGWLIAQDALALTDPLRPWP